MSSNLSFGGDDAPWSDDLAEALAARGLPAVAHRPGPLRVWSVKQAAPALLDAVDVSPVDCPTLASTSLLETAFVPIETESFSTSGGCVVASLHGLIDDLERLGPLDDAIAEDARCRFLLAARSAREAEAVLWLG